MYVCFLWGSCGLVGVLSTQDYWAPLFVYSSISVLFLNKLSPSIDIVEEIEDVVITAKKTEISTLFELLGSYKSKLEKEKKCHK